MDSVASRLPAKSPCRAFQVRFQKERASSQNVNAGFQPKREYGLPAKFCRRLAAYVRTQHSAVSAVHSAVSAVDSAVSAYIDAGNKEAMERLPAKITYGLPAKTVFALFWS